MDKYMKRICEIYGFGTDSTRKLNDSNIASIEDLIASKQSLREEGFAGVLEKIRSDLLKVIALLDIFEVVELGKSSTRKLIDAKIVSIDALISSKQSIREKGFAGLRESKRSDLLKVIKELEIWRGEGKTDDDILNDFTEEEFERISNAVDEEARKKADEAERELRNKMNILEEYKRKEFIDLLRKPCDERHLLLRPQDELSRNYFIQKCIEDIMTDKLRASCSIYNELLTKSLNAFDELAGNPALTEPKKIVIAGRTQSGKSSVKGVVQSMCGLLKIPLVVLTKGVHESIDLHQKLLSFSEGTEMEKDHILVRSNNRDKAGRSKNKLIERAFGSKHGGTLVIADTVSQVEKAIEAIKQYRVKVPNGKFVLIIDEADAMYRTPDKVQKLEQSLQELLGMKAAMEIYISASPMPLILELMYEENITGNDIDLLNLQPNEDYVGLEDIKPLTINKTEVVYLEQNELKKSSECCHIPYANEKMMYLYNDALSELEKRKGVLVLDCTCPRMYAKVNVTDKANAVLDYYGDIVVITYKGSGIEVRYSNNEDWEEQDKGKTISEVLEEIDAQYGLEKPVFIFGFIKMCRGISFRSAKRVPTHMAVSLGRGHNSSTVLQTIGRATFNGKSILLENGFETVKILTTQNDFRTSRKTQQFISEVHQRMKKGNTMAEALEGSTQKYPHALNFLHSTFREIGKIKGHRKLFQDKVLFEEQPMELDPEEETSVKEKYWKDADAQAIFRSIARLSTGANKDKNFCQGDILDDLKQFANGYKVTKTNLRQLLNRFFLNSIIQKDVDVESNDAHKLNMEPERLAKVYMNKELDKKVGEIPIFEAKDEEGSSVEDLLEVGESRGHSNSDEEQEGGYSSSYSGFISDGSQSIDGFAKSSIGYEDGSFSESSVQLVSPEKSRQTPPTKKSHSGKGDYARMVSQDMIMSIPPSDSDLSSSCSKNDSSEEDEDVRIETQDTMRKGSTRFKRMKSSNNRNDHRHKKRRKSKKRRKTLE